MFSVGGRGGGVTPCRFFASPQGCRFGDSCRYSHDGGGGVSAVSAVSPPVAAEAPAPLCLSVPAPPAMEAAVQRSQAPPPPCRFFASPQGCRFGAGCRFSHNQPGAANASTRGGANGVVGLTSAMAAASVGPAPIVLSVDPAKCFSIDVECVASGTTHNDRVVAQIALVDADGWSVHRPWFFVRADLPRCPTLRRAAPTSNTPPFGSRHLLLLANSTVDDIYIKPSVPVVSFLTPLTGLTAELIAEKGVSFAEGLAKLKAKLPTDAVLVGQNIAKVCSNVYRLVQLSSEPAAPFHPRKQAFGV